MTTAPAATTAPVPASTTASTPARWRGRGNRQGPQRPFTTVTALVVWAAVIGAGVAAALLTGDLVAIATRLPPLHARWDPAPGPDALPALAVASAVVLLLPGIVARSTWRAAVAAASCSALGWGVALAVVGGRDGVFGPAAARREYLAGAASIGSPLQFLREFPGTILDFPVHIQGHPPGYPIVVWAVDRLGWGVRGVTVLQVLGGVLAVPAVLLAVRALAGDDFARRAAPFVAVAPAAVWLVSSADAFFAGIGAWGVALVVLSCTRPRDHRGDALAFSGGALLGIGMFLSYGMVLLAVVPLVVLVHRRAGRALLVAAAGGAVVVATFAALGFWWFDGLAATHGRYVSGIASRRPYGAFLFVNLAALAIVVGPATAVGLARLRNRGAWLLVGGALAAVALADVSGMSKGEVERIWLPFAIWLLPAAGAACARRSPTSARPWLVAQCALALLVQVGVRTPW